MRLEKRSRGYPHPRPANVGGDGPRRRDDERFHRIDAVHVGRGGG
ncbi:hypothetical protein MYA_1503 [Burkholderia sp. KJ006]|nr:hypothetical protein MYA_1503 [Burkholderia sp. KJ006]